MNLFLLIYELAKCKASKKQVNKIAPAFRFIGLMGILLFIIFYFLINRWAFGLSFLPFFE